MERKNVIIHAAKAVKDHLESRGCDFPFRGVLVPHTNRITGQDDPYVTFYGKKGGAGLLCLSTILKWDGNVEEVL